MADGKTGFFASTAGKVITLIAAFALAAGVGFAAFSGMGTGGGGAIGPTEESAPADLEPTEAQAEQSFAAAEQGAAESEASAVTAEPQELEEPEAAGWQAAYNAALDNAASYDYGGAAGPTGTYMYQLVELNNDPSSPELLLGSERTGGARGAGEYWFRVFTYDAANDTAHLVGGEASSGTNSLQWGTPMGLGVASDRNGLVSTYMGGRYSGVERVILEGDQLVYTGDSNVTGVDLRLHDVSDRSLLAELDEQASTSAAPAPASSGGTDVMEYGTADGPWNTIAGGSTDMHDYECMYFTIDVPDEWVGHFTYNVEGIETGNPTYRFSVNYNGIQGAGSIKLDQPKWTQVGSSNIYYTNAGGTGFFGDGLATITPK